RWSSSAARSGCAAASSWSIRRSRSRPWSRSRDVSARRRRTPTSDPSSVPDDVAALVREREELRRNRDFAAADALRARIESLGFSVTDAPHGSRVERLTAAPLPRVEASDVQPATERTTAFSVHWLADGWPDDVRRGIESFRRFGGADQQHVVVDTMPGDPDPSIWPDDVEAVALRPSTGWAAARNAGLRRSTGSIVLVVDASVEA